MLASACVRHNNSGYSRSRYELENKRVIVSGHELMIVAIFLFGIVAEIGWCLVLLLVNVVW